MASGSKPRRRQSRRSRRSGSFVRWLLVCGVAAIAFLYYRPIKTYVETRRAVEARRAEVRGLEAQRRALERRLAAMTSEAVLAAEARRLGWVKPGERLFIVKGIRAWRKRHGR